MNKKYLFSYRPYFFLFVAIAFLYIVNGYAKLATNDDWALQSMLVAKGVYGTLIMSYPLSFMMSKLYDYAPYIQWYSLLLTLVIALHFYLISQLIAKSERYTEKILLTIFAFLWLSYLLFFVSITTVTMITMVSAVGFIRRDLRISIALLSLASLLRTDIMIITLPYYVVAYFILREHIFLQKKEIYALLLFILLLGGSFWIGHQDKAYNEWKSFNKVRSGIVDSGIVNFEKANFTTTEKYFYKLRWWQEVDQVPSEKLLRANVDFVALLTLKLKTIDIVPFLKFYKFHYWFWLLLLMSLVTMLLYFRQRSLFFIPILIVGIVLLVAVRDVERVTISLLIMWAFVLFMLLEKHKFLNSIYLLLFVSIFYYYISGQFVHTEFDEVVALQKEASSLLDRNKKGCEVPHNVPTSHIADISMVTGANYLFHESHWLKIDAKHILPTGWLSRHPFFYETHRLSDAYTKREFETYHDYLVSDDTGFFGSPVLKQTKGLKKLLHTYDQLYLKERPLCRHVATLIDKTKHFGITQIHIVCDK